uniref:Uncharacterized protein n=1 Tax=Anas platyrhynchos platyrhynchos TaxID=8840 RepID=A0A493TZ06_ANAPP
LEDGQSPLMAHPEVLGVHMQLLTVQLGQLGVGCFEIFQVLHGFPEGGEHFLAMGTDLGVANDGGGAGQVPEVIKEPLGPGVDDQQPGLSSTFLHVDLAPEAVHHGVGRRVACGMWSHFRPLLQRPRRHFFFFFLIFFSF